MVLWHLERFTATFGFKRLNIGWWGRRKWHE